MNFYLPTHIFHEKNCVLNHADKLCSLGSRALIVTGKHSSRTNGSLNDVINALDTRKIPYTIFDETEQNPSVETVMKAAKKGLENGTDFVIGVGGGSPLDASKAIALMIANPGKSGEILYQKTDLSHLPVACIPTTAGTGSEATPYAILTLHKEKTKRSISHKIFPEYAFCDASYLETASRDGLVNTAADTLAHLIESSLNTNSTPYSRIFSEKGLVLWGSIKDALEEQKLTDKVYETLLFASTLGGIAISHTGTSLPHGLSYPVTYHLNVPHGKAVGIFLGGYVAHYGDKKEADRILSLLDFPDAASLQDFLSRLLNLSSLSIPEDILEASLQGTLSNPAKLKNYPFPADYELMKGIAGK